MEFLKLSRTEYDQFARSHPYRNFLNSATSLSIKQANGWEIEYVGVKEGNQILCASGLVYVPCMKVFTYAYAQRGYLIDYTNKELLNFFHNQLVAYLKDKGVIFMKLDPYVQYQQRDVEGAIVEDGFKNSEVLNNLISLGYQHAGFTTGFSNDSQVRWMVVLDLEGKDEERLLQEMDHQTRWSVNKTKKLGIKVRELSLDELDLFKEIMDYAASTRDFFDMPLDHYKQQLQAYKEDAKLMLAYLDVDDFHANIAKDREKEMALLEEIQSVLKETPNSKKFIKKEKVQLEMLETLRQRDEEISKAEEKYGKNISLAVAYFIRYEDELVYLTAGAYDELRKYNGPYAIQSSMLNYAIEHGIKRYNFYGTSGIFDKSAPDFGVFEFKKGFNGVVEEYVGDFIYPIAKMKYQVYQKLRK